ncbi:MAG: hypothetical protein GY888_07710, partial [Planctomycetaceae bacterium]|nr:hypothetical protein [Planctomycetaceae bacterium]
MLMFSLAPASDAQLVAIPLTPDLANSTVNDPVTGASAHGSNLLNATSDPFAYDPDNPTANLPATNWNGATHYHGPGAGNPTVYWGLEE